jgi:hypothetical protein
VDTVFLSCADEDAELAGRVMAGLSAAGIAVSLAHPRGQLPALKSVARELTSAKCIIVLWTKHSVQNELVLAEADYARGRDIQVSAVVGKPRLPLGFRDVWFADLSYWTDDTDSDSFLVLKRLVSAHLNPPAKPVTRTPRQDPTTPARAATLFLCYRREDTQDAAGRLHDRLVDAYGAERVFMDIDSVPLGIDFVEHVAEQISRCSAVIVMIGRQWLKLKDKRRRRRLDNDDDLVRVEIAAALTQGVPVIPVLVQDVSMPEQELLPDNIRPLARRNGIALSATRWRTDVERLLRELDRVMKPSGANS